MLSTSRGADPRGCADGCTDRLQAGRPTHPVRTVSLRFRRVQAATQHGSDKSGSTSLPQVVSASHGESSWLRRDPQQGRESMQTVRVPASFCGGRPMDSPSGGNRATNGSPLTVEASATIAGPGPGHPGLGGDEMMKHAELVGHGWCESCWSPGRLLPLLGVPPAMAIVEVRARWKWSRYRHADRAFALGAFGVGC